MTRPKLNNPYQESILVEAQATYYRDIVEIYKPKTPIVRRGQGFESKKWASSFSISDDAYAPEKETNTDRSVRRSKKRIGDYVLSNDFDMFVTFTFRDNRDDVDICRRQMVTWFKNQRNRNGKFRYLIVAELHKNGALHFHALIGGYLGKIERAINPKTNKPLKQKGRDVYTLNGYTLGFTNAKLVGNSTEDHTRLGSYIKKYITKDLTIFPHKQRYWVSKGLTLPLVEDNPELWYLHVTPDWSKELPNGTLMRFNLNRNSLVDMFWEDKQ